MRLPPSRGRLLKDMDDERRFHLEMRVDELMRLGMNDEEAWREARRRFGDEDGFRAFASRRAGRRGRQLAVWRWIEEALQDLRVALRQLRRAPMLSATVMLTLALCIGATTAAYGIVRHLLLAPLPFRDGNRIVSLEARTSGDGEFHFNNLTVELVREWGDRARTIHELAAIKFRYKKLPAGSGGAPDTMPSLAMVTPSFLPLLRVHPLLGRGLSDADARAGAAGVALLGENLWRTRYGSDSGVIGRSISVKGELRTVVGVLPSSVTVPTQSREPLDIVVPLDLATAPPGSLIDGAFARIGPGSNSGAVTRELEAILRSLPDTATFNRHHAIATTPPEQLDPRRRRAVEVLLAVTVALLLIACADVAGLLLMRGWGRRREFAVRRALGISHSRLTRQLLTESLLLAIPSGLLGLLVAWMTLRGAVALRPWTLAFLDSVRLDGATFLGTTVATLMIAVVFGAAPAWLAAGRSVDDELRSTGSRTGQGRGTSLAHGALVVSQLALSMVFLVTAGVLARSFVSLVRTPVGFEAAGLFQVTVQRASTQASRDADDAILRTVHRSLANAPGVADVAVGTLPLTSLGSGPNAVDGKGRVRAVEPFDVSLAFVSAEYFRVAGIPLVRGAGFAGEAGRGQVIINEALARRLWPDGDALGARMRVGDAENADWLTVVGVAGNVRMPGASAALFELQVYRPASAAEETQNALVIRAERDTAALRPMLARAIENAGVGASLTSLVPASWALDFAFGAPRFAVVLFGAFAVLAVILASLGLFGIVAYAVARRRQEIAVRVALGASSTVLTRVIVGGSSRLVALGCTVGLVGSIGVSRAIAALVYGVSPTDPATIGAACVLLAIIALSASALPLRQALRVDPASTLRAE